MRAAARGAPPRCARASARLRASAAASSATRSIEGGNRVEDAVVLRRRASRAPASTSSRSRKGGKFEDAKQPKVGEAVYPYTGPSGHECMPTVRVDERGPVRPQRPARGARSAPRVRAAGSRRRSSTRGGISTFEQAEAILARGEADIVGAARQSLADPDWFLKIRARPRRRDPPLRVHELLRGARPAAQAGDLQALGSRARPGRPGCDARERRAAPAHASVLAATGCRGRRFLTRGFAGRPGARSGISTAQGALR